ncbi:5-(carboxyamino)imidazole ribonucleotide synthase [Companilactobacillus keshanensis]|uniref:N5-carboxyaminoimidazole ribonucleotide synthase n=1 Tax=Companilactobacillus keshanensis TaxID=2486003 RepID=A0ABW4BRP2_9LACO|nr:5-(carboxyamino)imidazole ribonucleotide synthase [Companilactobacillus keshanensis]
MILNRNHLPGETIGIIGGGQLGQMMAATAKEKGYKVIILDPIKNCSAAQVSDEQIVAKYDNLDSLIELSKKCDVLTYEFENVDAETIEEITKYTDVPQGTKALIVTQNRIREKNFLSENNFPIVPHTIVKTFNDFQNGLEDLKYPVILKTVEGGYDGKGQILIDNESFDESAVKKLIKLGTCILESKIDLLKEVSIVISSNLDQNHSIFPMIENKHHNNILHISNCPARVNDEVAEESYKIARQIARLLNLVGTLCVEFFISKDQKIYVNEIAPRPHNSGHLTIEACNISQFDAHIRGICGWPMPKIELFSSAVMINLLGQHIKAAKTGLLKHTEWNFHDYGKDICKINRKMGHITILSKDTEKTINDLKQNSIWKD